MCCVLSRSVMSDSLWPHGLFVSPWGFSRQEYWSGLPCHPPGGLPNLGIEPRSPILQADCLPSEPPGKHKNTEAGGLSLLQGIFPTQELNQGLLHCRQILYQLIYEGRGIFSPIFSSLPSPQPSLLLHPILFSAFGIPPFPKTLFKHHLLCEVFPDPHWQLITNVSLLSSTWKSSIITVKLALFVYWSAHTTGQWTQ